MGPKLTPAEGKILGTAGKMFTIAGPVIVYGVDNGRLIAAPTDSIVNRRGGYHPPAKKAP